MPVQGIRVEKGTEQLAINVPFDILRCPVNSVDVPDLLRVVARRVRRSVVGRSIAFTEVICLDNR